MISLLSHVISGALVGLLYALIAMGFVIIYRSAKVFNLAQGEFVVVGAFLIWSFSQYFNLSLWLSLVLAFVCSAILGFLVERIILPGERKEYFTADKDIWKVATQIIKERKKREQKQLLLKDVL